MRVFSIGVLLGVWLLQWTQTLPSGGVFAAAAAAGLGMLGLRKSVLAGRRLAGGAALAFAGVALGFAWAGWRADVRLADSLAASLEGRDVEVSGLVAGLPQVMERGARFDFAVEQAPPGVPRRLALSWYRVEDDPDAAGAEGGPANLPVRAGERWRFTVRLKRPHGNLNPGGFDYEAWLLERGIRATGYVRTGASPAPVRLDDLAWSPGALLARARDDLRRRYFAALPAEHNPHVGILVALAMGDQQSIDSALWQVFARTGITHLMSISGLHVAMFAGLAYAMTWWGWRRSARLPLRVPAQQAAALGGFVAAFGYALLAGFAVPAQRTLYMLGVVAVAQWRRREMAAADVLALALLLVLAIDPWAVLSPGFWLSFGAVALLFYAGRAHRGTGGRWKWLGAWVRAQWAVTLGMLPALLALFQQFSLVSPLANALAIPLVSLAITPLALAGALPFLSPLLWAANALTDGLMLAMGWLARQPLAVWQQAAAPAWALALALAGGIWALLPRRFPARWLGLVCFLPLLNWTPPRPPAGAAQARVLDVGQGLAVHVQTATHDLLFDAGPAFSAEADSGNRIIVPYLRAAGVRRLDTLVISHRDRDHEGGAASVLSMLPVGEILASLPFEHPLSMQPVAQRPCRAGERWHWDGVEFAVLHPVEFDPKPRSNAVSCVLRVAAGGQAILLASDIEAAQESALAGRRPEALRADILVVPHHGSRTSSTPEFVAAVGAREAVFAVGYRNRFGHPKDEVVARYAASGARLHRTDRDGAIGFLLGVGELQPRRERERRRRYWHGR